MNANEPARRGPGNPRRSTLIAGASGLVGSHLLRGLLDDATVSRVHAPGRRELSVRHPKLTTQVVDFLALPPLPAVDEVYLALGTTIRQAGSQAAFRAVDLDANLAVARAALAAGARRIGLVSAMGADAHSRIFYNRVKGELEDALTGLGPEALVIARPSFLIGDRSALGRPVRRGEALGIWTSRAARILLPENYRPIEAARVADALRAEVPVAMGKRVLSSGELQRAGAAPQGY